ncbi:hypothetical protein SLEP1_g27422 [Rubroshorea leprosula]|uniref:Uncharacterized protein n=1 Tax=Rubroshorea leprosula TaxID=152421 RepID=A0AAV5JZ26_9ROSI|nr:hypothetical protein SLEP1_g27422 [Rubroshorea leprosula]
MDDFKGVVDGGALHWLANWDYYSAPHNMNFFVFFAFDLATELFHEIALPKDAKFNAFGAGAEAEIFFRGQDAKIFKGDECPPRTPWLRHCFGALGGNLAATSHEYTRKYTEGEINVDVDICVMEDRAKQSRTKLYRILGNRWSKHPRPLAYLRSGTQILLKGYNRCSSPILYNPRNGKVEDLYNEEVMQKFIVGLS